MCSQLRKTSISSLPGQETNVTMWAALIHRCDHLAEQEVLGRMRQLQPILMTFVESGRLNARGNMINKEKFRAVMSENV